MTWHLRRIRNRSLFILIALLGVVRAADAQTMDDAIVPDAKMQALSDNYHHAPRWTCDFYQQMTALHDLTKEKVLPRPRQPKQYGPPVLEEQRDLIRQAAYYFAQSSTASKEDANGLMHNDS